MTNAVSIAQSGSNNVTFRNRIINGGMQVGQRGSTVFSSTNNLYGWVDRWLVSVSGTTVSALGYQASGLTQTITGYALQVGNVTTTGATTITVQQRIEALNCRDLNGSAITVSGKVMQQTGSTQTLTLVLNKANAVDNFNGGVTQIASTTVSVPNNTWTPVSWTVTLGASDASNGIAIVAGYNSLSAQSNTQFYFGDFQLEKGTAATPFEFRQYGTELALCQRYYQIMGGYFAITEPGREDRTTGSPSLKVSMRAAPTVTFSPGANFHRPAIAFYNVTSVVAGGNAEGLGYVTVDIAAGAGTLTAGQLSGLLYSAEL